MSVTKAELVKRVEALLTKMTPYMDMAQKAWRESLDTADIEKFPVDLIVEAHDWLKNIHDTLFEPLRSFMTCMPLEWWPRMLSKPELYRKTHEWPIVHRLMTPFGKAVIMRQGRPVIFCRAVKGRFIKHGPNKVQRAPGSDNSGSDN